MKMPAYIQALKTRQKDAPAPDSFTNDSGHNSSSSELDSSPQSPSQKVFNKSSNEKSGYTTIMSITNGNAEVGRHPTKASSGGGGGFRNSLAFFQKAAANLVAANGKSGHRHRDRLKSPSGREKSSLSINSHSGSAGRILDLPDPCRGFEDPETYEQVLFINGRPQYKDDSYKRSHSYDALLDSREDVRKSEPQQSAKIIIRSEDTRRKRNSSPSSERSRSCSWTRVHIGGSEPPVTPNGSTRSTTATTICREEPAAPAGSFAKETYPVSVGNSLRVGVPVPLSKSCTDVNYLTDFVAAPSDIDIYSAGSVSSEKSRQITLPRRKPVLNFGSISDDLSEKGVEVSDNNIPGVNNSDEVKLRQKRGRSTITRAHSFKEGLDVREFGEVRGNNTLVRTQSCYDGINRDSSSVERSKPSLKRVPSVEEILESVKTLRAKRNMVKSTPDLHSISNEKNVSSKHHKSSKSKSSSSRQSTGMLGVHYNNVSKPEPHYERLGNDPDYEVVPDGDRHNYYENIGNHSEMQYENLPTKSVEVIYDSPKSGKPVVKHVGEHYENVNFDQPYYENLEEDEPTYMNVTEKNKKSSSKQSSTKSTLSISNNNLYANVEAPAKSKSRGKVSVSGPSSTVDNQTYDVPRAATHIYDTPSNQNRKVNPAPSNQNSSSRSKSSKTSNTTHISKQTIILDDATYDTPKNNRSILPVSTQIVLKAKTERIQKIDDIFADCEKDSLDGERGISRLPDIPSPDYGSDDEGASSYEGEPTRKSVSPSSSDYIDEGLGESDGRSFYADEQGLEVILEEPEDEDIHSSSEDLRRRSSSKGERRSLDGSEGIGSAEGETLSEGEEEDTSSPEPQENSKKSNSKESPSTRRKEEDRTQKDRSIEVYPETIRQRQRSMAPTPNKVDIKNWCPAPPVDEVDNIKSGKGRLLPSVKALRSQFENGRSGSLESHSSVSSSMSSGISVSSSGSSNGQHSTSTSPQPPVAPPSTSPNGRCSSASSTSSLVMGSLETSSGFNSLTSSQITLENDEHVEPIYYQFKNMDQDLMGRPLNTAEWNPMPLVKKLYHVPNPKVQGKEKNYINIEGYLEKLPSGRKKATFWNAWKRRYFVAKDGVLYYYQQNSTSEKASMKLPLQGGRVEMMDPNMVSVDDGDKESRCAGMLGIDDGKGHYVVVRCSSRQEAEKWRKALESHIADDCDTHYLRPWPRPTNPTLLRDVLVIDLGSSGIRAGVLASQVTLPQLFFPSVAATNRETRKQTFGSEALLPDVRSMASISFPLRQSHRISKYSIDLSAVTSFLQKTFSDLNVDPKNYYLQLSVPRILNPNTQTELLRILFEKFSIRGVNLTHQSILALYAYEATSGIVVDVGERIDVVPVIDGYIVDGGVSRIPYGGHRIQEHLRKFLFQKNICLVNEVESFITRQVLESVCYCAHHYNTEKARCNNNTEVFEKTVPMNDIFPNTPEYEPYEEMTLDFGRFQATEGLFNPDSWGLDHPGLHKLVHKAIQECSMDIRKEMSRSIFLSGGVTQLPGFADRLATEMDNLTPTAIRPKVHASPYRYHAAYIGACALAESPAFAQSRITREEWLKHGTSALRKWSM